MGVIANISTYAMLAHTATPIKAMKRDTGETVKYACNLCMIFQPCFLNISTLHKYLKGCMLYILC